jgi:hypothetical protein
MGRDGALRRPRRACRVEALSEARFSGAISITTATVQAAPASPLQPHSVRIVHFIEDFCRQRTQVTQRKEFVSMRFLCPFAATIFGSGSAGLRISWLI